MSTSNVILTPPDFDENKTTWREYKKEVEVWSSLTSLSQEKQGPALWMALKGKAKEAVKEMEISDIKKDDGLTLMMEKLDEVFKTDDNQAAYLAYRDFENFVRPPEMSFQDFVIKFEAQNSQIVRHKMVLPDGVLAYRFLHSANLKEDEVKLCRATISDFTYDEMKRKVLSLFGDKVQTNESQMSIKSEPVFMDSNHPAIDGTITRETVIVSELMRADRMITDETAIVPELMTVDGMIKIKEALEEVGTEVDSQEVEVKEV